MPLSVMAEDVEERLPFQRVNVIRARYDDPPKPRNSRSQDICCTVFIVVVNMMTMDASGDSRSGISTAPHSDASVDQFTVGDGLR